jgi:hypothetical protein
MNRIVQRAGLVSNKETFVAFFLPVASKGRPVAGGEVSGREIMSAVGKTAHVAIAGGFAAIVGVASVLVLGDREATAETQVAAAISFVRPVPEIEPQRPALDLKRDWSLADRAELARLSSDPAMCLAGLDAVSVNYAVLEPSSEGMGAGCGVQNALSVDATLAPFTSPQVMTCALAARLYVWQLQTVAPAAEELLGSELVGVESLGSFSCRRVAGSGRLSEHSFGKAADIGAFRLADGRRISVEDSYWSKGAEGQFLRRIHEEACELFDVTLGPAYNHDHRDHFHLDVGGNSACR